MASTTDSRTVSPPNEDEMEIDNQVHIKEEEKSEDTEQIQNAEMTLQESARKLFDFVTFRDTFEAMQHGQGDIIIQACQTAVTAARGGSVDDLQAAAFLSRYTHIYKFTATDEEPEYPVMVEEPANIHIRIAIPKEYLDKPEVVFVAVTCNPLYVIAVKAQRSEKGEHVHEVYLFDLSVGGFTLTHTFDIIHESLHDWGKESAVIYTTAMRACDQHRHVAETASAVDNSADGSQSEKPFADDTMEDDATADNTSQTISEQQ